MPELRADGRAERAEIVPPLRLAHPLRGRWTPRNSPADRVPSHGTERFATALALDLVPVGADARTGPFDARALLGTEPPERFPGFGRDVLAPCEGRVVKAHDGEVDHDAHRGLASLGYALTQGRRAAEGWSGLAGNHVVIATEDPHRGQVFVALCHLQRGSIRVRTGDSVRTGDVLASCGNSGNSMEPHVHLQAMEGLDIDRTAPVPFVLPCGMPRRGEILEGAPD